MPIFATFNSYIKNPRPQILYRLLLSYVIPCLVKLGHFVSLNILGKPIQVSPLNTRTRIYYRWPKLGSLLCGEIPLKSKRGGFLRWQWYPPHHCLLVWLSSCEASQKTYQVLRQHSRHLLGIQGLIWGVTNPWCTFPFLLTNHEV